MTDRDGTPPAAALAEDVEDLKARFAGLRAEVAALRVERDEQTDSPVEEEGTQWRYPPFILLLDGEARDDELRLLAEWVEGVLVPGYLGEPSADARWCHLWIEHEDAVAHLHALWLAWQELTDPATCGYTGPSVWHRDHYRPCMTELRRPGGPFAGCTKGEHRTEHRLPGRVPSAWHLDD
ncbi:DUF4913 domain-containing protein [Kitasatospora brasiliensis]|uniref:DUF4913 domain-containing protein n=1 Tax=Kitasatospora brasiliensis TaxID=3058040 RepID=UPI00292F60CA|nr:DUF4913 domain-containing protein [Kitasatospora sp. K002]